MFVANSLNSPKARKDQNSPRLRGKKKRCRVPNCRKKLNITNTFSCRCSPDQMVFCAKHRHPELHGCTFDYKAEGRKYLEKANPLLVIPKLPKI